MKITRLFLFLSLLFFSFGKAQLAAYINGKEVKPGSTISKKDLPSLQISFKKPKEVNLTFGYSKLYIELADAKNKYINHWAIQKDGYVAIEDFLKYSVQKKINVFGNDDFMTTGNTLQWILDQANGMEDEKSIRLEVGLMMRQETGYKEYGPKVQLLEPIFFNVPIWETKDLFLPYLDLKMDKTNIPEDIDLFQTGKLDSRDTELGYRIMHQGQKYNIFAFDSKDHPGLNVQELAKDFIYLATFESNGQEVKPIHKYDTDKYIFKWNPINNLGAYQKRLGSLNYRENKDLKTMDLTKLYQPAEFNKLKGYTFRSNVQTSSNGKWTDGGAFQIYILNHPTNPNLTLMLCNDIFENKKSAEEIDSFLKLIISSIKQ